MSEYVAMSDAAEALGGWRGTSRTCASPKLHPPHFELRIGRPRLERNRLFYRRLPLQ